MNKRFEDKYLLSRAESHEFFFKNLAYLTKDHEAIKFNNSHKYEVNSVYFDTYNFISFHQKLNGDQNKFKLRLRNYGTDESYLELKLKCGQLGHKYRLLVESSAKDTYLKMISMISKEEILQFHLPLSFSQFKPVLKIRYIREAYRLLTNRNVKVNLDTQIKFKSFSSKLELTNFQDQVLEVKYASKGEDKKLNFNRVKTEYSKYLKGFEHVYYLD